MSDARANILARLKAAPRTPVPPRPDWTPPAFGDGKLTQFRKMIESVHGEVHDTTAAEWPERLRTILANKGVEAVLYGAATSHGAALAADWSGKEAPSLVPYSRRIEEMKDVLVHQVQAGVTSCRAAIAETGSLVLWPTAAEPRLMSLLPPIHVALLSASTLADSLAQLIAAEGWIDEMPTNALLISGPSKTADIEQTLAYGVHGPKELIVLVLADV
ncbi:MAG TPA: lactate utilization protein [Candidatus Sulfotelmatobacter sp.]|jgi:L-lactate dehydrogenase complex protein LldG|nr:lactate utilization protein [Candidatus Sulfotelmatobacter sp.]